MANQPFVSDVNNDVETRGRESAPARARRYRRVIDAHMHWYPQAFVDLMNKKGPANGAVMGEDDKGQSGRGLGARLHADFGRCARR